MRLIAFTLLATFAIVSGEETTMKDPATTDAAVTKRPKICEPGTSSKMECNTCICSADGTFQACTLMMCLNENLLNHEDTSPNVDRLDQTTPSNDVTETTSFQLEKVDEESLFDIDQRDQPNALNDKKETTSSKPEKVVEETSSKVDQHERVIRSSDTNENSPCEPGTTFKRFCNTCRCSKDGSAMACTLMMCPPGVYNEDGTLKIVGLVAENPSLRRKRQTPNSCEPGKNFKSYCNSCKCSPDGTSSICTKMECPPGRFNRDGSLIVMN